MFTNEQIRELITEPKRIVNKNPRTGYREEARHRRCDLDIVSEADFNRKFTAFVRQNQEFIENFSIGLRYETREPVPSNIVLVRYNGPHGEYSRSTDGHYALPHIHRITEEELRSGSIQPQERHRQITNQYGTLTEALSVFSNDIGITNFNLYFHDLLPEGLPDGN